jgi:hypothetical protein
MNIKRPSPSTILAATTGTLAPNAPNIPDMSYYTQEYHQRKLIHSSSKVVPMMRS